VITVNFAPARTGMDEVDKWLSTRSSA